MGAMSANDEVNANQLDDAGLLARINELAEEQKRLRERASDGTGDAEPGRIGQLEVELDRLWDLRRQREAKEEFGQNPDSARERPASEVEGYLG